MVSLRDGLSRAQEFQVLRGLHRQDIQGMVEVRRKEGTSVGKFFGLSEVCRIQEGHHIWKEDNVLH